MNTTATLQLVRNATLKIRYAGHVCIGREQKSTCASDNACK